MSGFPAPESFEPRAMPAQDRLRLHHLGQVIIFFSAASSIGLPSGVNCAGAMMIAAGFQATAFENADLARDVGFGLGAELSNVDAEILTGLACASQHGLPVDRCRIFHDDRNRWFRLRHGRRPESKTGHNTGYQALHEMCNRNRLLRWLSSKPAADHSGEHFALDVGDAPDAKYRAQLFSRNGQRRRRRSRARRRLRKARRQRCVECDVAFHLLYDLMNMTIEHLVQRTESLATVYNACSASSVPQPQSFVDRPQRDMSEDDDRRGGGVTIIVLGEPGELLGARRPLCRP